MKEGGRDLAPVLQALGALSLPVLWHLELHGVALVWGLVLAATLSAVLWWIAEEETGPPKGGPDRERQSPEAETLGGELPAARSSAPGLILATGLGSVVIFVASSLWQGLLWLEA